MKELSIEEKAKAYDRAIEELRGLLECIHEDKCDIMEEDIIKIFPELKESEDEKILKHLKAVVKEYDMWAERGLDMNDVLAWLKNQGTSYTKRDVDDAYLKGVTDTKNEIEKQYEANYQIRKDIATFIFNYRGDIKDRAKWMDYLGIKVSFVEKQGKQKETLCDKCKKTQPSHSCQDIAALGRCALEKQDEQKPKGKSALEALNEEKVDNANKVEPKFNVGDVMRTIQEAADGIKGGMPVVVSIDEEYYHCTNELIAIKDQDNYEYPPINRRQKPAWSEEDEKRIEQICEDLRWGLENFHSGKNVKGLHFEETIKSNIDWLKFLKDRVQPKQEWSEEDENRFINLISLVKCSKENNATKAGFIEFINKLKSLKPQSTWKPSDEQMKALSLAMCGVGDPLFSLYQDLEKLKG